MVAANAFWRTGGHVPRCHSSYGCFIGHRCLIAPAPSPWCPGVYATASERYYKVAAEALRVCERVVPVLRQDVEEPVDAAMVPVAQVSGVVYKCPVVDL